MANDLAVLETQLKPLLPMLQQALMDRMPAERLMRTIIVSCERQSDLLLCTRQSLFGSAMTAAVLGLEVDGVTGQAYLVPFNDKRLGKIAQLLIGYKGFNTLGARSGFSITADVVREHDDFDFAKGSKPFIHHKPNIARADSRIIAAWACATSNTLPAIPEVMALADLEAVRARSKASGSRGGFSPWDDPKIGLPAMYAKTVRRRLPRSMPLNALTRDYHLAARMEEAAEEQGMASRIREDGALLIGEVEESPIAPRIEGTTPEVGDLIGPKPNAEIEKLKAEGREAAEGGPYVLATWWARLTGRQQHAIEPRIKSLGSLKPEEATMLAGTLGAALGDA